MSLTFSEIEAEVASYEFRGAWELVQPRLEVQPDGWGAHDTNIRILIRMRVPHRGTGEPTEVQMRQTCPVPLHMLDREFFHRWLQSQLQEIWMHEFHEGLWRNGELVKDPHANDRMV